MAAAARTRDRDRTPAPASPPSDAYVGLLGISLGALILGCILLFLDYNEYPTAKPTPPPTYTGLSEIK